MGEARCTVLVVGRDPSCLVELLRREDRRLLTATPGLPFEGGGAGIDLAVLAPGRGDPLLPWLTELRRSLPGVPVIVHVASGSPGEALAALKAGAFDYIAGVIEPGELEGLVAQALRVRSPCAFPGQGEDLPEPWTGGLVGSSPAVYAVSKRVGRVAATDETVLIRGASGTGKELVARAIHRNSLRAGRPFVVVNCAALAETLLESELFGHERGAFTGAAFRKQGRFELASGGTLFLDEIGDMSPATQAKILRALEGEGFERLGGSETVRADVRILAATHLDLEALVRQGRFRADLLYRLQVVTIVIPPLCERMEDVPELARHFLRCMVARSGGKPLRLSDEALAKLCRHRWPGNVRELEHCLRQAGALCREGVILPEDVLLSAEVNGFGSEREDLLQLVRRHLARNPGSAHASLHAETEALLLREAMQACAGNLARAAREVGLSRPTLREKLLVHGLRTAGAHDPRSSGGN